MPPPENKPRRRSRWGRWLILWLLVLGFLGAGAVCITYAIWASTFDIQAVKEMPSRSTVYDMDGKMYSRAHGENRIVVPLRNVSRNFIEALLAREDSRFYHHHGVDPLGIFRAVVRNVLSHSAGQGASTITQQLARNSYPERISGQTKNAHRKLLEAFVALRIEQHYSKDEILEDYVNRIYFGVGVYGIEAASMSYFGKHASDLSLGEAALLAGLIRGPGVYSPFTHLDRALKARDAVLDRMVKLGQITAAQAEAARNTRLSMVKKRPLGPQQNYIMDAVERDLAELLTEEQRVDGGLKIYTTIDPALQKAAEGAVDAELRKVEARPGYAHPKRAEFTQQEHDEEARTPYLQGAVTVIDNRTGAVRALVGGRDYAESSYNRAIMARRQVGSTFKPFVYATAFRRGMLPGMLIDDGPLARGEVRGAPTWTPENSDGSFKGLQRAEDGLILSRNTMSVRVGQFAGLEEIARTAASVGIADLPRQPAVYLGAFEANLEQLTSAYSVFPNNGLRRQSYLIERVDDAAGDMLYRAAHVQASALDAGVSWVVTSALTKVMERGTAATSRSLGWKSPAAGKTGTTNDFKDAWFVGYTTSLTCGVWVGLDRPETIIQRGYGAALALPIWIDVMSAASPQRYPAAALKPAIALTRCEVCAVSNGLATLGCEHAGASYSIDLPSSMAPPQPCSVHQGGVLSEPSRPAEPPVRRGVEGIFRSFRRFFGGD